MVHSVFFCAACGSGERKATAPFLSFIPSLTYSLNDPSTFVRSWIHVNSSIRSYLIVSLGGSFLPTFRPSLGILLVPFSTDQYFIRSSVDSIDSFINSESCSCYTSLVCLARLRATGKWMFQRVFLVGTLRSCTYQVSTKYPQSIHKVSTKYPRSIHKVSTKYPQSIHKVSIKYPSSRKFLSISGSHFSCKPHVKADFLRRLHFSPQCGDPHLGDQHRWLGLPKTDTELHPSPPSPWRVKSGICRIPRGSPVGLPGRLFQYVSILRLLSHPLTGMIWGYMT